jgi:hypothetical protein
LENNRTFESVSDFSQFKEGKEEFSKYEIEPMFYIHLLIRQFIISPHMAFMNGQEKSGLQSIIWCIFQLEKFCKANDFFKSDNGKYEEAVKKIEEDNKGDGLEIQARRAVLKSEYLLREVFSHRIKEVILYV